jgi:hypothetical protein
VLINITPIYDNEFNIVCRNEKLHKCKLLSVEGWGYSLRCRDDDSSLVAELSGVIKPNLECPFFDKI